MLTAHEAMRKLSCANHKLFCILFGHDTQNYKL